MKIVYDVINIISLKIIYFLFKNIIPKFQNLKMINNINYIFFQKINYVDINNHL